MAHAPQIVGEEVVHVLDQEWHQSQEANQVLTQLYDRIQDGGILISHDFPKFDVFGIKLLLEGSIGAGKSSIFNLLTRPDVESSKYASETQGLQMSKIAWPAKQKMNQEISIYSIELWDAGHRAFEDQKYPLNVLIRPRYDHIQEACTQNVTVRALVFSLRDRSSWESAKAMVVNEVYAME
eukprot:gene9723-1926_t